MVLIGSLALRIAKTAPVTSLNSLPVAKYVSVTSEAPKKKNLSTLGIEVDAKATIVMDVESGQVLYERNSHAAYPVASLTKLISMMVFLDSKPNMDELVTIMPEDDGFDGKTVFPTGEQLTKRELFQSVLVGSVNEAANALARTTGGKDAFVVAMNKKARAIGMEQAFFMDPSGLNATNKASARDIALALREALHYPEMRETTGKAAVTMAGKSLNKKYSIRTTNLLLSSDLNKKPFQVVVAKTGTLPEAGYCMAQATQNVQGQEVIAVVLGGASHFSRFQDVKALTYWSFENFEWKNKQARGESGK